MEYRSLGTTGVQISEIGFGCGNTAGLLTGGDLDTQLAAIRHALDLGINYFDTAPNYGERAFRSRGLSETNLGKVLKSVGAQPLIGTKIELHAEHLQDIPGAVARSVDESLERLGVDSADILYLHNRVGVERGSGAGTIGGRVTLDEMLGPGGILEAFERQRQEGKVRFLAFCSSGGDPSANRQIIIHGGFHCVQLSYNFFEPTEGRPPPKGYTEANHGQTIELAGAHGLGVVVIRVLAGGVLSGASEPHRLNTGSGVQRQYAQGAARARALRFLDRPGEQTMVQAAVRFGLTPPQVSTVLVGFSEAAQIDEPVKASGQGPLSDVDLARIEDFYAAGFDQPTSEEGSTRTP